MENKNKIESGDIFISLIFVGKTETIPNTTSHIKKLIFIIWQLWHLFLFS